MTFVERYKDETTWYGKAMVMEIYHLAMTQRNKTWTVTKTAQEFGVSIGLVSENLRLAYTIHTNPEIMSLPSRQEALRNLLNLRRRQYGT